MATPVTVAIVVMARSPVSGQVKTRLCPPLSGTDAAALASAFLADVWTVACALEQACALLAYAGPEDALPAAVADATRFPQVEGDLGTRMIAALQAGLEHAAHAIVIGSDLPGLPIGNIRAAHHALVGADAVLGPTEDGGYYLLGMKRAPTGLLDDLPWSAADTMAATRSRLQQQGYRVAQAPVFRDVDDAKDLDHLREELLAGRVEAPATAAALERISWPSR